MAAHVCLPHFRDSLARLTREEVRLGNIAALALAVHLVTHRAVDRAQGIEHGVRGLDLEFDGLDCHLRGDLVFLRLVREGTWARQREVGSLVGFRAQLHGWFHRRGIRAHLGVELNGVGRLLDAAL